MPTSTGEDRLNARRALVLCAAAFLASEAYGAERKISSPLVEGGVWEIEARGDRTIGPKARFDDAVAQEYEIGYGVTPWWRTSLANRLKQRPGGSLFYQTTGWENVFQLTPPDRYWLDFGLFAEYARAARRLDPDEVELKLLFAKAADPFAFTLNLAFDREFGGGADRSVAFGYAARTVFAWTRGVQAGVEAYGEPGRSTGFRSFSNQEHIVGPVVLGKLEIPGLPGTIKYNVGYLFGITSASRKGLVKWEFQYEVAF